MPTLREIYQKHKGKVSDKWSLYLDSYHNIFLPYRSQPINLLEIGVQNGGSLEVWAEYFPNAQKIIGCDINPKCSELQYSDKRIQVVIGNAIDVATQQHISQISPNFDIIIDDGSHTSNDIIHTFFQYFELLKDGGTFIFEDLHCSYWQEYDGGLYHPYSSIAFFKSLIDIINHEHWGLSTNRNEILRDFYQTYHISPNLIDLSHIHSIEFLNSICIITKRPTIENELGIRSVVGDIAIVNAQPAALSRSSINQSNPPYPLSPQSQIKQLEEKVKHHNHMQEEITSLQKHIENLTKNLSKKSSELDKTNQYFYNKLSFLEQSNQHLKNQLAHTTQKYEKLLKQHLQYKKLWTVSLFKPLIQTELAISSANRYRKGFRHLVKEKGSTGKAYQYLRKTYKQTKSFKTIKQILKSTGSGNAAPATTIPTILTQAVSKQAKQTCALKVAIIADMSLQQCKKYRVIQKQEMLQTMGIPCSVVSWTDYDEALRQISLASVVIFYRVPSFDSVMELIGECRRLKIKTFWEVDDLIFDEDILKASKTVNSLDKANKDGIISEARFYLKMMLACDEGIASTSGLAKAMQDAGLKIVHVIENALDKETLAAVQKINSRQKVSNGIVRIIYGSGSKTYNIDFLEAAPALIKILKKHPHVRFRYIGFLELPDYFDAVKHQIEHIPFCSYPEYLGHLSECDISIAPLENFIFNDAKSNIKYLEASITGLASVCSPRAAFADAIEHGKNAMLADSDEQWLTAFDSLIEDETLRKNIAEAAYENVIAHYSPEHIGKQLATIVQSEAFAQQNKTKILTFNVYYAPQSFGGATIVAEQINALLAEHPNYEVFAVTTLPVTYLKPYSIIRYEYRNVTVFGVAVPPEDSELHFNPRFSKVVESIIELVQPDIAHLHSIQGMGVEVVDVCKKHNIKTIATMHDAWWICPNQFMLDSSNRFKEDWEPKDFPEHYQTVSSALAEIDLVVAPSRYFADLHIKMVHRAVEINKNGVKQPQTPMPKTKGKTLRFGYVSGMVEIKGVHLILEAFKQHNFDDTELIVVDNLLNLGSQSFFDEQFQGINNYKIVPAYNQDNIDQFFASIDVLLFPTQCKESFGLVAREAILRNVWVIATDAGGVVEDIIDGKNGTIIPFDSDAEQLSDAIHNVCKRYQAIEDGAVIDLPKDHIHTFEEQKDELIGMYQRLLSKA